MHIKNLLVTCVAGLIVPVKPTLLSDAEDAVRGSVHDIEVTYLELFSGSVVGTDCEYYDARVFGLSANIIGATIFFWALYHVPDCVIPIALSIPIVHPRLVVFFNVGFDRCVCPKLRICEDLGCTRLVHGYDFTDLAIAFAGPIATIGTAFP